MKQVKSMITESSTSPLPKINVIENILIKHKYSKQLYKKLFIIGAIGKFKLLVYQLVLS